MPGVTDAMPTSRDQLANSRVAGLPASLPSVLVIGTEVAPQAAVARPCQ